MAKAYTFKLAWGVWTAPVTQLLYTAPAGRRIVVRDLAVTSLPIEATIQLSVLSPGGSDVLLWYRTGATSAYSHLSLRQALNAGDQIWLSATGTATHVLLTGYDLDDT